MACYKNVLCLSTPCSKKTALEQRGENLLFFSSFCLRAYHSLVYKYSGQILCLALDLGNRWKICNDITFRKMYRWNYGRNEILMLHPYIFLQNFMYPIFDITNPLTYPVYSPSISQTRTDKEEQSFSSSSFESCIHWTMSSDYLLKWIWHTWMLYRNRY